MASNKQIYRLRDALDVQPGELVSLVGAGGKTTLMFALALELEPQDGLVITTTTTKIVMPETSDTSCLLITPDEAKIVDFLLKKSDRIPHITLVSEELKDSGKLKGVDPEMLNRLISLDPVKYIIAEADGAARRPLKAPDIKYEPVMPNQTSLVVPVVGFDALGREFNEDTVFRSKKAARITRLNPGDTITSEFVADLITHSEGITYGTPDHARVVPIINKIDSEAMIEGGRELAYEILSRAHPKIDRVVLTSVKFTPPVLEVVYRASL